MSSLQGAHEARVAAAQGIVAGPYARGMAFLGYGLLFLALPTAGTSALLALILAYARRDGAAPLIRSHHQFQIRIFWIGLALGAAALALALAAVMDAGRAPPAPVHVPVSPEAQLIAYAPDAPSEAPAVLEPADIQVFTYSFGSKTLVWRTRALLEGYAAGVLLVFATIWGLLAPLYGAARLASGRAMGHSPD